MDWFLAAIVSAIALSGQVLMFQQLQKHYAINMYMAVVWLASAITLSILFLRPDDLAGIGRNMPALFLAGITSLTGNYALNRAIRHQSNIGYVSAVMSWRLILTYVFSLIVLNAAFEAGRLVGVALIVCGVLAVSGAYRMNTKDIQFNWVKWALLGGLSFGLMSIFARYANDDGVRGEITLIVVLVVAGIGFLIAALQKKARFRVQSRHSGLFLAAIVFAVVGNGAQFVSYAKTPNLAYAIAIDNSRIILLYLVGLMLFHERLQGVKALGILLTFSGILLLS